MPTFYHNIHTLFRKYLKKQPYTPLLSLKLVLLINSLNIGNLYRPPNELNDSYNEFIRDLSPILSTLENNKNEVITAGNFNIDLLKLNDKHTTSMGSLWLTAHYG